MLTRQRWNRTIGRRTAPVEPVHGPTDPAPTPAPAPAPAPPAAFDPATLTPEARAYLDARVREADTKARTTTRDNAAAEARKKLLAELTGSTEQTPEQIKTALDERARELAAVKARNTELEQDRAIWSACNAADVKADADLVGALLARQGKLKDLDPTAADFAARVQALVKETVAGNPRLKLDVTPAAPAPGGSNPVAPVGAPPAERKKYGSIAEARAAQEAARTA